MSGFSRGSVGLLGWGGRYVIVVCIFFEVVSLVIFFRVCYYLKYIGMYFVIGFVSSYAILVRFFYDFGFLFFF